MNKNSYHRWGLAAWLVLVLAGTSTNATLSIAAMRFYQLDPPPLTAEKA